MKLNSASLVTPLALVATLSVSGRMQTSPGPTASATDRFDGAAFEVASVKTNRVGGAVQIRTLPSGTFMATNVPLRTLIRRAYELNDFQLVGGPDWISSERFDVVAKAGNDDVVHGELNREVSFMLRSLLAERFRLNVRDEMKDLSIYALVLDRKDGKLNRQLQTSTADCGDYLRQLREGTLLLPQELRPECGTSFVRHGNGRTMRFGTMSMADIANSLQPLVRRVVVDKTGLSGMFSAELSFADGSEGPSIITALQEQLGLKLVSQRGRVRVLAIQSVERPT